MLPPTQLGIPGRETKRWREGRRVIFLGKQDSLTTARFWLEHTGQHHCQMATQGCKELIPQAKLVGSLPSCQKQDTGIPPQTGRRRLPSEFLAAGPSVLVSWGCQGRYGFTHVHMPSSVPGTKQAINLTTPPGPIMPAGFHFFPRWKICCNLRLDHKVARYQEGVRVVV